MITRECWSGNCDVEFPCGCKITFEVDYDYDELVGIEGDELQVKIGDYELCERHKELEEKISEIIEHPKLENLFTDICEEADIGVREACEEGEIEAQDDLETYIKEYFGDDE